MKRRNRIKVALQRGCARTFVLTPVVFLLVAGAGCPSLFESPTQRATHIRQAVPGGDGAYIVPAANTVVNVYAQLAGAADPIATNTTITVNDVNGNFLAAVAKGDLLLIVQMAGATMDTTDSETYGTVTNVGLGSAGSYEFVGVEGVTDSVITLACGLKNGYSRSGKTQVIRVPQYTILTIASGRSITARAWDGVTGGVVAVHADTTLELEGSIDVTAKGFRGGAAPAAKTSAAAGSAIAIYRSTVQTNGAEKGEGIAGYPPDFATGQYGRGAPANGGGGGDSHNAGGGGGANAGDPAAWNRGLGVMMVDPTVAGGTLAWPREVATLANSEGGGRGGYSYSANGGGVLDPTTLAGAPDQLVWGGDDRRAVGGRGGHPVANSPAARLFMGGGGGAGDGNNGAAGPGGRGGGLIFIIAGAVAGTGTLHADGGIGGSTTGAVGTAGDAAGGGGGGGTVVVSSGSIPATIVITANGGVGGDHTNSINANEVEGPGGGGGGGYIAVSGGTPSRTAAGALGGTTTLTTSAMDSFRTNGATAGPAGGTNGSASTFFYCGGVFTTIKTHPANPTKVTTGTFTFTNTSDPVTYECKLDTPAGAGAWAACNASDPSTPGYTTGTLTDGSYTLSVRATDTHANLENPPVTYTWLVDTVLPVTTIATHPETTTTSTTGVFTFTNTETASLPVIYECKLDTPVGAGTWAACNASAPTTAGYTTGTLTDGSYTLTVRSTDKAGNVEANPPIFTWLVQSGGLDGGVDAEPPLGLDGGGEEASALLDAEGVDAFAKVDLFTALDVTADRAVTVGDDTAPVVRLDATEDAERTDLLPRLDAGNAADTKVPTEVASADTLADTRASGAEPNADTAGPVANDDVAAPPVNEDAAPVTADLKIMGSGFCAIASSRSTSPWPFMVMALAALALVRRRRKR
jgi:MYXO-CTERM domain-containing protein